MTDSLFLRYFFPAAPNFFCSSATNSCSAFRSGDCHLIIEGETHGKIHLANGRVTVGASGRVNADIAAPEIVIEGNVQGNLQARDNVRMGSASHVQGSVLSPRIRIEDGASFRGKVEMARPGHAAVSSASAKPAEEVEVSSTAIVGTQRG